MPCPIRYHFTICFNVPARKAFQWCTDYAAGDHELMGKAEATRVVTFIAESTVILTDTFQVEGRSVEKQKVVELYPDRLCWNATHLTGPTKYSQFLYEITADDEDESHLDFTGLFLDYKNENLDKTSVKTLARKLRAEDAYGWKLLAKAMEKELGK